MTAPKVGDRVRVTIEGEVVSVGVMGGGGGGSVYVRTAAGTSYHPSATDFEILPPPEPEYIEGEVYRDADGLLFVRGRGYWSYCRDGEIEPDDYPERPLVRLVPEVTP